MSAIDDALRDRMLQLAERIESQMPKGIGTMIWFYNREGTDLDLTMCSDESVSETLRILRATTAKLLREDGGANPANERWFSVPEEDGARSDHLVSSAAVTRTGGHDRVRIWSRGALAGELVVDAGDGPALARLLGLPEKP